MRLSSITISAFFIAVTVSAAAARQDAAAVVADAARAMGAEGLRTLTLTGSGSSAGIGQNVTPTSPWPLVHVRRYTRSLDFEAMTTRFDAVRIQNGAETTQSQTVSAGAPWSRQFEIWVTTPYAFLRGARSNPVTLRSETIDGSRYAVVSFTLPGNARIEGFISDKNLVERVRTWVDNDVMGDMLVEGVYRDYRDVGGVKIPGITIVKQGGFPTFIAGVKDATVNGPLSFAAVPAAPAVPVPTVTTEKIGAGLYVLKGGSHHSVLVEFGDHLTLIEAPQNEARALALLAEIKKLYRSKPLTDVVNTHHHFDHAGGLRAFVDAGVTVLTHDINKPFFEQAFKAPRTLNPDRLERSKKTAAIVGVGDTLVLSDAARTMELHHLRTRVHDEGMLIAFLPKEKLVVEVDMYTPPAPNAPAPPAGAAVNPNATALVEELERLRLDFETIVPLHGAVTATRADLYAFVKKPLVPISSLPDPNASPAGRGGGRGGGAPGTGPAPGGAPPPPPNAGPGRGNAPQQNRNAPQQNP